MFGVGQYNASCLQFLVNSKLNNCFWKVRVVLRRTYKFYSSGPEKD